VSEYDIALAGIIGFVGGIALSVLFLYLFLKWLAEGDKEDRKC